MKLVNILNNNNKSSSGYLNSEHTAVINRITDNMSEYILKLIR